jgi:salicylate hydroxylase
LTNLSADERSKFARIKLNIIVVGAGIGGLATAIALAISGHEVTVYEQAQELGEVSRPLGLLHVVDIA